MIHICRYSKIFFTILPSIIGTEIKISFDVNSKFCIKNYNLITAYQPMHLLIRKFMCIEAATDAATNNEIHH